MLLGAKEIGAYKVHTKRRNHLEQQRLNILVFVKYNLQLEMRQKVREEKGDTYDPICLSDMESDDDWVTKKEDPCLPNYASWMDIHESFTLEEGAPSHKKRRGPRNLTIKVDRKGKCTVTANDNEIEDMVEDVEEEDENELQENVILEEEDDISDLDLGDDD